MRAGWAAVPWLPSLISSLFPPSSTLAIVYCYISYSLPISVHLFSLSVVLSSSPIFFSPSHLTVSPSHPSVFPSHLVVFDLHHADASSRLAVSSSLILYPSPLYHLPLLHLSSPVLITPIFFVLIFLPSLVSLSVNLPIHIFLFQDICFQGFFFLFFTSCVNLPAACSYLSTCCCLFTAVSVATPRAAHQLSTLSSGLTR